MCSDAGLWLSDLVIGSALLSTVLALILQGRDFSRLGSCPPECAGPEWQCVCAVDHFPRISVFRETFSIQIGGHLEE